MPLKSHTKILDKLSYWQMDDNQCARLRIGGNLYTNTMSKNDLPDNRQTKPTASRILRAGRIDTVEAIKQTRLHILRDLTALVVYRNGNLIASLVVYCDANLISYRTVTQRVVNQITEELPQ